MLSLYLNERISRVQLVPGQYHPRPDHPIVLTTKVQKLLTEIIPEFFSSLRSEEFSVFTHSDILQSRFSDYESLPQDEGESFVVLMNVVFCRHLRGFLEKSTVVEASDETIEPSAADLFFKVSGRPSANVQLASPAYVCLRRSYRYEGRKPVLELFSVPDCRGGVFSVGKDLFDICFFVPAHVYERCEDGAEALFSRCTRHQQVSSEIVNLAEPISELIVIPNLVSYIVPTSQLQAAAQTKTFLIGQNYVFSQPSYLRGLNVIEKQIRAIQSALDLSEGHAASDCARTLLQLDGQIRRDWQIAAFKDSAEAETFSLNRQVAQILRFFYNGALKPLEQNHTGFYRQLLLFFQDKAKKEDFCKPQFIAAGLQGVLQKFRLFEIVQIFFIVIFGLAQSWGLLAGNQTLILSALFLHIVAAYFINDYADYELDGLNPRKKHRMKPSVALSSFILVTAASFIAAAQVSWTFFLIIFILNLVSYIYSAPPFRLKEKPGFSLLIHCFMGGAYILTPFIVAGASYSSEIAILAALFGLILGSGSLANEYLDADADREGGLITLGQVVKQSGLMWPFYVLHVSALGLLMTYYFLQNKPLAITVCIFALVGYQLLFLSFIKRKQFSFFRSCYRYLFSFCLIVCIII